MIYNQDERYKLCLLEADKLYPRYKLHHCFKTCFLVTCDDIHDLGMLFLRPTEFNESSNEEVKNSSFYLSSYIDYYRKNISESNAFTYPIDVEGYNVSGSSIRAALEAAPDYNPYDQMMLRILNRCEDFAPTEQIYLIGTTPKDQETLTHELAHGMWALDVEYREQQHKNLQHVSSGALATMHSVLREWDYHSAVFDDEVQAFIVSGVPEKMKHEPGYYNEETIKKAFSDAMKAQGVTVAEIVNRKNLLELR